MVGISISNSLNHCLEMSQSEGVHSEDEKTQQYTLINQQCIIKGVQMSRRNQKMKNRGRAGTVTFK